VAVSLLSAATGLAIALGWLAGDAGYRRELALRPLPPYLRAGYWPYQSTIDIRSISTARDWRLRSCVARALDLIDDWNGNEAPKARPLLATALQYADQHQKVIIMCLMGLCLDTHLQDKWTEYGLTWLRRAATLASRSGDSAGLATALFLAGQTLRGGEEVDSVYRYLGHAQEINRRVGNRLGDAECSLWLGWIHYNSAYRHEGEEWPPEADTAVVHFLTAYRIYKDMAYKVNWSGPIFDSCRFIANPGAPSGFYRDNYYEHTKTPVKALRALSFALGVERFQRDLARLGMSDAGLDTLRGEAAWKEHWGGI
jgi:hypothetical protein